MGHSKTKLKAQAAMEYLMTYGWALLVIVIVIAILVFINPSGAPETCIFNSPGFLCENIRLYSQNDLEISNVMYAKITNGNFKSIEIVGMACSTSNRIPKKGTDGNFAHLVFRIPQNTLEQRVILTSQSSIFTGMIENNPFVLQCLDIDSNGDIVMSVDPQGTLKPAILKPGEMTMGAMYILYRFTGEPSTIPPRMAQAKFSTRVN